MNSAIKAIVAAVVSAAAVAHTLLATDGILTPMDWQTIIDAVIVPILVYFVPNLDKPKPIVPAASAVTFPSASAETLIVPPAAVTTESRSPIAQP